ncbi:MAG TPA: prephenate dehydrogenase [Candidatus Avamphibacillus intestinigallinarum]|nr:prephenate dehydrogenase [Candidatus Avamphibacillus intestinigallinarum]
MKKQTVLVAGLGLIGGSIAKAISKEDHVIGYDIDSATLEYALEKQIIDEIAESFEDAALKSDFIFLASPISSTIDLLKRLDTLPFSQNVIISDACSVKGSILEVANQLENPKITFIGGHPMAGSHKKGIWAAKSHLFENAIYVLSPTINATNEHVIKTKELLKHTLSRFVILTPEEHDEMTGVISHFPHLVASSLVHQAKKWQNKHQYLPELAAGGFRDITRIASSNPTLWQDIFAHNQGKMSVLLNDWIEEMTTLKNMIERNEKEQLTTYLTEAKTYRDGLGERQKGALTPFYDIYVDIKDRAGAIANVVQLLADHAVSIQNIRILEIREGITGALRISLPTKDMQDKSLKVLNQEGYEVSIGS